MRQLHDPRSFLDRTNSGISSRKKKEEEEALLAAQEGDGRPGRTTDQFFSGLQGAELAPKKQRRRALGGVAAGLNRGGRLGGGPGNRGRSGGPGGGGSQGGSRV